MSTFNEIEMTTPYGDTDNVLELNIDSRSDAYVLQDVIKLSSTYTLSIWYRTEIDSQITFNVLGESEIVDSTTSWNKYVKTVTVETLDETSIYIIPSVGVNSYFYEGYLVEGITDTSWLPAPEDIEGEIGSVRSELRQTAESILLKVSDSNGRITTLETNLEGITTEISDAKGSSTTLQARLEGIDTSVVNAETSAKSFATQEAERIQSVVQNNIDNVESNINQRADNIEMSISSKQDTTGTSIRYIRDWLDGSNVDNKNYWGEINVITHDGENILDSSLIRLQAKNEALSTIMINDIERIKDGTLSSYTIDSDGTTVYHYSEDDYVINTGKTCIEIDLGQIYNDIDYIRIWHRFADGKFVFNHKLQTSIDGVTWVTLYDSSVTGGYEESVDGKLYYLNESNIISSMNKLSMTLNETRSQLSDTSGNLSTLTQTVKGINETVSKNYEEANSALEKLREDLNAKISETEKALANFRIEAGNIYATAESVDKNNNKLASLIQQSSSGWEALFAELNMGENKDKYNIQTNITLNKNGITVTNPTTGQTTQMTIDQFCGLYHGEKVFWIDKDTTKTRRLLCEKGWDTDYIKMTTNAYKYANGTVVKGVAFVKSGGTS